MTTLKKLKNYCTVGSKSTAQDTYKICKAIKSKITCFDTVFKNDELKSKLATMIIMYGDLTKEQIECLQAVKSFLKLAKYSDDSEQVKEVQRDLDKFIWEFKACIDMLRIINDGLKAGEK